MDTAILLLSLNTSLVSRTVSMVEYTSGFLATVSDIATNRNRRNDRNNILFNGNTFHCTRKIYFIVL